MATKRGSEGRRLKAIRRGISVESLERRDLLASGSDVFTGPSLASLIKQAEHGKNTASAEINLMVDALQTQLTAGPLADLDSGTVGGNGFITEVQALEAGYELYSDDQLGTSQPSVSQLINLQGQRVVDNLLDLNQQETVGLISAATLDTLAASTIKSLTAGPIFAIGTKASAITSATTASLTELTTTAKLLAGGSLTLDQAAVTINAEAEAYRSDIHAGLQVTQLRISGEADTAIDALEQTVQNIVQTDPSTASTELTAAITTFSDAVGDKTGLFGTKGALGKSRASKLVPNKSDGQATSVFSTVSGTSSLGGTATLTATLTSADGSPLMGEPVDFTINGAFAGTGITNFHGVATVEDLASTAAAGANAGAIVATFRGETNFLYTGSTGSLTVTQLPSVVSNVSGSAVFGGAATLTATLSAENTGDVLAGRTIKFSVDGTSVGSALTNASGVATLTGVNSTNSAGTDTGGIVASFAGGPNYAASASTGNLVVSQTTTTLSAVSGSAQFGGNATLAASLLSASTGAGVADETVTFTLDGKSVGTATTNSEGLATLAGVATSDAIGSHAGAVVATFAGDSNNAASTGTGNLVVSQAETSLSSVGGTAIVGGTATLTATLTSLATNEAFANQTVDFTLGGKSVGSAVTDSDGLATLSDVAFTGDAGTVTDNVVATYPGDTDNASTTAAGNLVISQVSTTLSAVSGSAEFGGPATLTATLENTTNDDPIVGKTVTFTLNGTKAGSGVTNSSGVATVTGVSESYAVGTLSSAIVANFAGDTDDASSASASGNFIVSMAPTSFSAVGGTAVFGGTATLTATLKSAATNAGVADEDVTFSLNGTDVGKVLTNASGVATLSGVATSAAVGTESGAVSVSFTGDTDYVAAPQGLGNLVVSKDATTLSGVAGSATFGGKATLTATLKSSTSGDGLVGQVVTFSLDGTSVGTATTGAGGVATLSSVTTADSVGTHSKAVTVSFAGATDEAASQGTGDLVVAKSGTTLASVSGTSEYGGTATLTATLTSTTTSTGLAGETVSFTLDGVVVGTATTNSSGVATLTGVATSDNAGTDSSGVVASFAGNTSYEAAANGTGNLVVSKAPTELETVKATANYGQSVTVTAFLVSTVTGQGILNESVLLSAGGTVVGTGVTQGGGLAIASGGTDTMAAGTDTGGASASFAGDANYAASTGTGNFVVSPTGTTIKAVSGTAPAGGPATLMATLTNSGTGAGIAGETLTFTLDGTAAGTATTNSSGVAVLTGVPTSDPAGTDSGGVSVAFAGDANDNASNDSGDLVVS